MKIIVAGSRYFDDYALLEQHLDFLLKGLVQRSEEIEIVCGEANGADALGKRYAIERGYTVKSFPANWKEYGKSAGPKRNEQMGDYADALVAFWDGKSAGTKHMIGYARSRNLLVKVKLFSNE